LTPELLYLVVRAALALGLYAFLAALAYLLWRDLRAAAEAASARQRRLGRLVILAAAPDGASQAAGQAFPLLPVTSLGRAPTNTACLEDDTASLEHALLAFHGGQWWLEDLGSRNGTTLNDMKIEQPVVVTAGDVIGVGRTRLKLELD
jgi:hypothetical protein